VIELGAGVGFPSIVAHALGAGDVSITDGSEAVLKLADQNIELNVPGSEHDQIRTVRLRWNTDDELYFKDKRAPDYIIAADVTYLKKNIPDLLASIQHLSGPNTVALVSMEPRNVGEVENVLAEATKLGLSWKEESLPVNPEKSQCSLSCARMFALRKM
jgi:predicted nicotinamide N-methyase